MVVFFWVGVRVWFLATLYYNIANIMKRLLNFVPENDPILRQKCRELSPAEIQSTEIQKLIDDLFYTVQNSSRGVGLSANQVGRNEAISVVAIKPTPARPNLQPFNKVYVDTKITKTFGEKQPMWEGCLSTAADENGEPLMAPVPRFEKVQIAYLDRNGQEVSEIVDGFLAHVLQHETDHLNGILFTDFVDRAEMLSYQEYIRMAKV